ncbi:MAG: PKD domain-containing protein [Acidobacteriota bacterium]|nr:PKD domain-containing protein [Acidobacteriota bacterium]
MRRGAWLGPMFKGCAALGLGLWLSCSGGGGGGGNPPPPPPAAPSITGISPTSGSAGAAVTLTGTNLDTVTAVHFGATPAVIGPRTATQLATTVPAGASTGTISVTGPGGTATSTATFTVLPDSPTLTGFNPASGGVGTAVTIAGTNLSGTTAVGFNGTAATSFTVDSALQVTAMVPPAATSGPITVTTPGGAATSSSSFIVTTSVPVPTITGFNPASGHVGSTVVITGTNLSSASSVAFHSVSAVFTVNSATQITATVPVGATSGTIAITTPGGTATSATVFTVQGAAPTLAAFPGAEGFGGSVTGGRGGRVIYVTTLAHDPNGTTPGSFQWACNQEGARYILFKVSGLIDGDVQLTRGDVTIAGQTSPGGVIVRQFHTTEDPYCDGDPGCLGNPATRKAENWVLRHLRMRPANGGYDDALRILSTRRGIVDHCSMANAEDECVQVSQCNDITIQDSILAETLGGHANLGGLLLNYSVPSVGLQLDRITLVRNVWNRLMGRMPEMSRESPQAGASVLNLELSNNLLWDPGFYVDVNQTTISGSNAGQPIYYALNWVGNYAHARPDFPFGMMSFPVNSPSGATATFFSDNQMNLYPARRDYQLLYCCNDYPATVTNPAQLPYPDPSQPPAFAVQARHGFPSPAYIPSSQVRTHIHQNAGAFPRDPMDRRLMQPLQSGVFDPAPRDQNPYNDAFLFDWTVPPTPPVDTDGDGMPDAWEQSNGLNPNDPSDGQGTSLSLPKLGVAGYPNLEVYLHELHLQRLATLPPAKPRAGR